MPGPELSRRSLLVGGLAVAGATALPASPAGAAPSAVPAATLAGRALGDAFTLGVASGDPSPDGVVLWTRLAPEPLAADGRGGMPSRPVTVQWEVAEDDRFRRLVQRGRTVARPETGHSVHVELTGLRPGREYSYRFRVEGQVSPAGRTRTAPRVGSNPASLSMAFASCAQYEHGYFTAYRRLAEEEPELVLHLGDYQYEYIANAYVAPGEGGNVRDHAGPETTDLAGYRQRHAQYKTDLDLQAAHAVAPWLVVFDDHEVENNWADDVPEEPQEGFAARRAAAFQAYYENMPLRRSAIPRGPDIQVYRTIQWGRLASFHMMDTRQYRSDQACGDGTRVDCAERLDPARTITGAEQETWLLDGLAASQARWDVLGQQVFFAQRDTRAGEVEAFSMDGWDGYAASRQRIIDGFVQGRVRNPVVLTGDVHRHYANDITVDPADPASRPVGTELVCSSITSGGDGSDTTEATDVQLAENKTMR
ncbi:MAG TPA: alkaline phosphatase D family protein, partial [Actinomycetales bacterium]